MMLFLLDQRLKNIKVVLYMIQLIWWNNSQSFYLEYFSALVDYILQDKKFVRSCQNGRGHWMDQNNKEYAISYNAKQQVILINYYFFLIYQINAVFFELLSEAIAKNSNIKNEKLCQLLSFTIPLFYQAIYVLLFL